MRTVPRLFGPAVFVVAVVAHAFGIMFAILVSAAVYFFSKWINALHFLFVGLHFGLHNWFLLLREFVDMLQVLELFGEKLDVEMHVLVY